MHPDGVVGGAVEVARKRGQKAGHVGRAARHPEPGLAAVGPVVGEGVLVKVRLAVERDAGQYGVVERVFR